MRGRRRWAVAAVSCLAFAVIGSALAATAGRQGTQAAKPIVIGWAFDSTGAMAPFDGPALAAAKLRVAQVNAKGGVNGRKLQLRTCDTQGNKSDIARACALRLLGQKANVIFTRVTSTWRHPSCGRPSIAALSRSRRVSAPT